MGTRKNNIGTTLGVIMMFTILILLGECVAHANNLRVENGEIISSTSSAAVIQFDVYWNNSWRDNVNYDAAWIFVKYSVDGGNTWKHATLKTSGIDPTGFSVGEGTGVEISVPADRKGCFIQRETNGSGSVSVRKVQIVWDLSSDGVSSSAVENAGLRIMGMEMVYIPDGAFYAGDFRTSIASLVQGSSPSETDPWYVDSDGAIRVNNVETNGYYYVSAGNPGEDATGSEFIISASFPKGKKGIYMMKYEITEGQWVSFFNCLTVAQKTARDITGASGKNSDGVVDRNTVSCDADGISVSLRPDRVCGYLSWMDICAYADWAALRPMSELEFEKAARGADIMSVSGELSWGSTNIAPATTISGGENGTEVLANAEANCCYGNQNFSGGDGGYGPLRSGIFATATSSRQQAGASYYGVLELSGNVWERCVSIGNSSGRVFLGTNGDGELGVAAGSEGNATNSDWPGYISGQGVAGAGGSGFKGGSWLETATNLMAISNRSKAALTNSARAKDFGGRCVRTTE